MALQRLQRDAVDIDRHHHRVANEQCLPALQQRQLFLDHPQTLGNAERGEILFRGLPFVRLIRVIYRRQQFHRQQRAAGAINRLEGIQAPALPPVAPRFGAGIEGKTGRQQTRDQVGYHRYYRRGGEVRALPLFVYPAYRPHRVKL